MGRDDELRVLLPDQLVDELEQRELPLRRERGLWLVEDVEPIGPEAILDEVQERLAVRALVERHATVGGHRVGVLLDFTGDVEEALGAEEVTRLGAAHAADEPKVAVEFRLRAARSEVEVAAAALGVEAGGDGDGLDEGGLAAPVFADEERHLRVELERLELVHGRD